MTTAFDSTSRGQGRSGANGSSDPRRASSSSGYDLSRLRASAQHEISQLTQYSSFDLLLERAQQANQQVATDVEFKRPDRAYVEWLKSDAIVALLSKHSSFPYLQEVRKSRYLACRKSHEAQRPMFEEIQDILQRNGPGYTPNSRPQSSASASSPPIGGQSTNGTAPSKNADPLVARFSQLRARSSQSNRLPYPVEDDALRISSGTSSPRYSAPYPRSYGQDAPTRPEKPTGPRQMPSSPSYAPPHPPKEPNLPPITTNLPRAPSPIYSPARSTAAPPSVNTPHSTVGSASSLSARSSQSNPPQVVSYNGSYGQQFAHYPSKPPPPEKPRPPLPHSTTITSDELFQLFKSGYRILVIDVRSRELFDEGHIHAKNIVCIDPLGLKYGMSYDELIESLVLSPDSELDLLDRLGQFELVVFYDETTSSDGFLQGAPKSSHPPHLRSLYDILVEFNDRSPLHRPPALLVGGLDGWMDLVGPKALQTSNTMDIPASRKLPKPTRPPARRISIANNNSSREIRRRRLQKHRPLNAEEEREWHEKLRREQVAEPPAGDEALNGATDPEEPSVEMIHTYDDFFRRFPSVEQQSMTSPRPPPLPPHPPAHPPVPQIPSRPPPTVSRPSYGGVSDRDAAQGSVPRPHSQPPLYVSRTISHAFRLPRTGLKNFSNTCYMNATIQCLLGTTPLLAFFLNDGFRNSVQKNPRGSDGILPEIFANLLRGLWRNTDQVVRPISLQKLGGRLRDEWIDVTVQQDAKEYFDFLIDILHEDLNVNYQKSVLRELTSQEEQVREKMTIAQASKIEWDRWSHREQSAISHFFAGQHASRLRCVTCAATSTRYEPFMSIAVEIPQSGTAALQDCLRNYTKEEMLDEGEEWMCPRCKCRRQATKQILITRMPQVLCIHLKRFLRTSRAQAKIGTVVDFPLRSLDLGPCMAPTQRAPENGAVDPAVTPPFLYEAFAVMRHHGSTMLAGHYTAVVRDKVKNVWVNFNDDRVREVDVSRSAERLQTSEAYILFYERSRLR